MTTPNPDIVAVANDPSNPHEAAKAQETLDKFQCLPCRDGSGDHGHDRYGNPIGEETGTKNGRRTEMTTATASPRAIRDLTTLDLIMASDANADFHLLIRVLDDAGNCVDFDSISVRPEVLRDTFRAALRNSFILWMTPRDGGSIEFELIGESDLSEGDGDEE